VRDGYRVALTSAIANIQEINFIRPGPSLPYDDVEAEEGEDEESDYDPANDSARATPVPEETARRETRTSAEANANGTITIATPVTSRKSTKGTWIDGRSRLSKTRRGGRCQASFPREKCNPEPCSSSESELSPPPDSEKPRSSSKPLPPQEEPTAQVHTQTAAIQQTQGSKRGREEDEKEDAIEELKRTTKKMMKEVLKAFGEGGGIEEAKKKVEEIHGFHDLYLKTLKDLDQSGVDNTWDLVQTDGK
jgi:hypothetical protein